MKLAGAVLACIGLLALPATASAYRTAEDLPQFAGAGPVGWRQASVEFVVSDVAPTSLAVDDVVRAVDAAADTWGVAQCSAPAFQVGGLTSLPAVSGDGRNSIEWVYSGWVKRGFPAASPGATDVLYEKKDGAWQIVEADIYLNAELFKWSKLPGKSVYVDAVLVHELGHALGLLHPCEIAKPVSDQSAPNCDAVASATDTTMYPEYDSGQDGLDDDDVAGLCFLYPKSSCEQTGCPYGFSCANGGCERTCGSGEPCSSGSGQLGDPCLEGSECATGVCAEGRCMQGCGTAPGCGSDECTIAADGSRYCKSALGGLGDACDAPADCLGQQCIQAGGSPPLCTRTCGSGCPTGWNCASVDGRDVCSLGNQVEAEGGGCALASRPGSDHLAYAFLLSVICAGAARRRRRGRATQLE